MSLKRHDDGSPWSLCRRPWTVMYFTANGRALPCCIAPFSQRGYENYTLGDATQQTLQEIWNGEAYGSFRDALLSDRAAGRLCALRLALEPLNNGPCEQRRCSAPAGGGARGRRHPDTGRGAVDRGRRTAASRAPWLTASSWRMAAVAMPPRLRAREAGAEVIAAGRGYGRACLAATMAADDADIVVFMDGDGADDPQRHRQAGRADPLRPLRFRHRLARARQTRAWKHCLAPARGGSCWPAGACGSFTACATPTCARSGPSGATRCWSLECASSPTAGISKCKCARRGRDCAFWKFQSTIAGAAAARRRLREACRVPSGLACASLRRSFAFRIKPGRIRRRANASCSAMPSNAP